MRAVVNDTGIFLLTEAEPTMINCADNETSFFITNGFQSSKKITVKYQKDCTYFFQINATIDTAGILTAAGISLILFIAYIISGVKLLMLLANLPILVLIFIFFLNPRHCIVLKNWTPEKKVNR